MNERVKKLQLRQSTVRKLTSRDLAARDLERVHGGVSKAECYCHDGPRTYLYYCGPITEAK